MKYLCIMFVLILSGCATMAVQKTRTLTKFNDVEIQVTQSNYLKLVSYKGSGAYTFTMIRPAELLQDLQSAKQMHQKHDRSVKIEKKVREYSVGPVIVEYNFYPKTKSASVSLCFRNSNYQYLVDFECGSISMDDIDNAISAVSQSPQKIADMKKQIKAEKAL